MVVEVSTSSHTPQKKQLIDGLLDRPSTKEKGLALYKLAKIYYDKADLVNAERNFLKALELCEGPKDYFFEFKVLGFLVRVASEKLNSIDTEKYIALSETLVNETHMSLGSLNAECFYNLGIVKTYRGHFKEAKDNFELALKKSKEENEPEILAKCLFSLAHACYQEKKLETALDFLKQLDELLQIIEKSYLEGTVNLLYGNIYSEKGDNEKASKYFRSANIHLMNKCCWNLHGYILLSKGILYKKMGNFNKALWAFESASESVNSHVFRRLNELIRSEIMDVNDSNVDLYLDKVNRMVQERSLGAVDFKHRFVLLEILFLLAKNPGVPFDKEKLAKYIWKDEYNPLIHDKLIYTSVSRLRKLIEPKGKRRKYIIRGKDGYSFNPHVKTRFYRSGENGHGVKMGNIDLSSPV